MPGATQSDHRNFCFLHAAGLSHFPQPSSSPLIHLAIGVKRIRAGCVLDASKCCSHRPDILLHDSRSFKLTTWDTWEEDSCWYKHAWYPRLLRSRSWQASALIIACFFFPLPTRLNVSNFRIGTISRTIQILRSNRTHQDIID